MDIKKKFNWVFYGVSIEKKNPRRQSPQGKFFFFLFFFKHLTEIKQSSKWCHLNDVTTKWFRNGSRLHK
jgi:hypothetical protein